jgi:hypothetical protein
VRVGAWLEVIIVTTWGARCIKVAWWTWRIVAWATVVKLARCALTLAIARLAIAITCWAFAAARWAVTQLGAFTIACRAVTHTVTAHMAVGARGAAAFTTLAATATPIATTASGFGVANALHHFATCSFGCSSHHITAWGLA